MNNQNTKQGRIPGGAMKSGAIIAIVAGIFTIVVGGLFSVIIIAMGNFAQSKIGDDSGINVEKIFHGIAVFVLIIALLNIPSIIANIMLLKGKLNSSIMPGILVIIGLGIGILGIFCGVMILTGKFEDQIDNSKNENFLQRNFNFTSGKTAKNSSSEQTSSWRNNPSTNSSQSSTVESEVISEDSKPEKKK